MCNFKLFTFDNFIKLFLCKTLTIFKNNIIFSIREFQCLSNICRFNFYRTIVNVQSIPCCRSSIYKSSIRILFFLTTIHCHFFFLSFHYFFLNTLTFFHTWNLSPLKTCHNRFCNSWNAIRKTFH